VLDDMKRQGAQSLDKVLSRPETLAVGILG